eukprot:a339881_327.p2 GENE.a339881_327~~a339881_327.p2  ORF type:complete len:167 (+),score=78.23 a339881_327:29-502(+)
MSAPRQLDLRTLPPQAVAQLKRQLEEEMESFMHSFQGLQYTLNRFRQSIEALDSIKEENAGKEILVPLTSSMYIPGTVGDVRSVLVDVGTGYYVEKSQSEAQQFFERKIEFLAEQLKTVQQAIIRKRNDLQVVQNFLNEQAQAAQSSAMAAQGGASS